MIFSNRTGTNLNRKKLTIINQTANEIIADVTRADSGTGGTELTAEFFTAFQQDIINQIYPVGSIYISTSSVSPATIMPNTTWQQITTSAYLKIITASGGTFAGTNVHKHASGGIIAKANTTSIGLKISEAAAETSWQSSFVQQSSPVVANTDINSYGISTMGNTADQTINPYYYGVFVWKRT